LGFFFVANAINYCCDLRCPSPHNICSKEQPKAAHNLGGAAQRKRNPVAQQVATGHGAMRT
jgi:hypothetical protein